MKTLKCWIISNVEIVIFPIILSLFFLWMFFLVEIEGADPDLILESVSTVWIFVTIVIISLPIPIILSVYTWRNYREIISRSLLWRKSNVQKYDMQVKYTTQVFLRSLIGIVIAMYMIAMIIATRMLYY